MNTLIKIMTNPYGFLIVITILFYFIFKLYVKIRAIKLLKVLYRLVFIERKEAWFHYSEKKKIFSHTKSGWGCDMCHCDDDLTKFGLSTASAEKIISHRLINDNTITYIQYLSLIKLFNKIIQDEYNPITVNENQFTKDIKWLTDNSTLNVGVLLDEKELFNEYYCLPPSETEIFELLTYLKKERYITDIDNIWFTEKGLTSLNMPVNINDEILSLKDIVNYIK